MRPAPLLVSIPSLSILVLCACTTGKVGGDGTATGDGGATDGGATDGGATDGGAADGGSTDGGSTAGVDCDDVAELPLEYTVLEGFTGSEDFAFDAEGRLVSIDHNGSLVAQDIDGDKTVLVPGFEEAAGMRYLPGGDLVIAVVSRGELVRVSPEGAQTTILSGLRYPNGVEVDADGWVYVAEHDAGVVRQVDPDTGEYTIIAEDLYNPNGLRFSPDWQTLYVTSFGGGTVHAVDRSPTAWELELLGTIPGIDLSHPEPCEDLAVGDRCLQIGGGHGTCTDTGEDLAECVWDPAAAACAGLAAADGCTTVDAEGATVESRCTLSRSDGALFCPAVDAGRIEPCEGKSEWSSCRVEGKSGSGYCVNSWEDALMCVTSSEYNDAYTGDCRGADEGDLCHSDYPAGPWDGTCISSYGAKYCQPYGSNWSEDGGIDGINVDACNNVYVTEYVHGTVWRFPPGGTDRGEAAEIAVRLPSFWIPNMRWGSGIGGWEADTLYVNSRDDGKVFALDLGVGGGEVAFP